MKRIKWFWLVLVILLGLLAGGFVWYEHSSNTSVQSKTSTKTTDSKSSIAASSSGDQNAVLTLSSGQSDVIKGLKIRVKSLKGTDYKAFHSRNVVKVSLQLKNTTKSDLYVVASAPTGAFDTGFKNSDSRNMTGLATDDITASSWTSSIKYFTNDAGQLKDDQLISSQLQKKSEVILGISGKYRYLCWKLTPGQSVSGTAYGIYTPDEAHPKSLPVLKVYPAQIGVDKSQVDQYKAGYEEQADASQS